MRRFAVSLLVLALLFGAAGCGGAAFYISPQNGAIFIASGTITNIQLLITSSGQVTVITFDNSGIIQTLTFCGNVAGQFPPNNFVTASYRQSSGCDTVVQVS